MRVGDEALHARAKEILAYFLRNPRAADSLEGVARWRLQQETIHHTVEHVGQALNWLVELEFLVRDDPAGGAPIFRLNPRRSADAAQFMADTRAASSDSAGRTDVMRAVLSSEGVAPDALMAASIAWIDAVLLRYLHENPGMKGDLPGLTRSHSSVESLLISRPTESKEEGAASSALRASTTALATALVEAEPDHPIASLHGNLDLTLLELQVVLLCLAPEIAIKYQSAYGVLNDDLGRRTPTLGLLCAILGDAHGIRTELERSRGLARWRLLESGVVLPHADETLRLDPAVIAWLLGNPSALLDDVRLTHWVRTVAWAGATWLSESSDPEVARRLVEHFRPGGNQWVLIAGGDVGVARAIIERAARRAAQPIVRVGTPSPGPADAFELDDVAARISRAVRVLRAVPILDITAASGGILSHSTERLIGALSEHDHRGVILVDDAQRATGAIPRERCQLIHGRTPDVAARATMFSAAAAEAGLMVTPAQAEQLALAYPLPMGSIDDAIRLANFEGASLTSADLHFSALSAACRRIACPDLPRFGHRIELKFRLDEVVLPADRRAQLAEVVTHVRCAYQVLQTWGFDAQLAYGRGVTALFCGPSGTGKTMAAQAIARELGTETYVVDVSRVVSKFIGETEKNLDAVFNDAERAAAVLVFDEADALFGKRSEIKDAHDRYANIEVAYLLQRMEAFNGLAILTTNFRRNMDEAFVRRLRFIVEFPKPDAAAREEIWRRCLPENAPVAEDVNLRLLARRLELTGGNIRQITLRAAFAAAAERADAIGMTHILGATRAELLKLGMPTAEREMGEVDAALRRVSPRVA